MRVLRCLEWVIRVTSASDTVITIMLSAFFITIIVIIILH